MFLIWLQEKVNKRIQKKKKKNHTNVHVILMEEYVTQIKSGIMMNVDASAKNITFGILLHVLLCIIASITDDLLIMCDEIIDAKGKSYNEETNTVSKYFNKKYITFKT